MLRKPLLPINGVYSLLILECVYITSWRLAAFSDVLQIYNDILWNTLALSMRLIKELGERITMFGTCAWEGDSGLPPSFPRRASTWTLRCRLHCVFFHFLYWTWDQKNHICRKNLQVLALEKTQGQIQLCSLIFRLFPFGTEGSFGIWDVLKDSLKWNR